MNPNSSLVRVAEGTHDQSISYERSVHGLTNLSTKTHIKRVNNRPRTFHFIRFLNLGQSNVIIDEKKEKAITSWHHFMTTDAYIFFLQPPCCIPDEGFCDASEGVCQDCTTVKFYYLFHSFQYFMVTYCFSRIDVIRQPMH